MHPNMKMLLAGRAISNAGLAAHVEKERVAAEYLASAEGKEAIAKGNAEMVEFMNEAIDMINEVDAKNKV